MQCSYSFTKGKTTTMNQLHTAPEQVTTKTLSRLKTSIPLLCLIGALVLAGVKMQAQDQQSSAVKSRSGDSDKLSSTDKFAKPHLIYKIIQAQNQTFGYDIYSDEHRFIHQPCIPGLPGNEGFKTKAAAIRVAKLAISKMEAGQRLPTISIEELKKLQAIR